MTRELQFCLTDFMCVIQGRSVAPEHIWDTRHYILEHIVEILLHSELVPLSRPGIPISHVPPDIIVKSSAYGWDGEQHCKRCQRVDECPH